MGWKTRGGRSYFYRSERVGGRVVSNYVGSGELASLMADLGATDRVRREVEAIDRRERQAKAERFAARIARVCRTLTVAAEAIIEGAGYHRHHRGEWRKRRTMSVDTLPAPAGETLAG